MRGMPVRTERKILQDDTTETANYQPKVARDAAGRSWPIGRSEEAPARQVHP
jgi:hypothetical protein